MKFLLSTLLLAIGAAAELRGVNKNQDIRRHLMPSGTECVTYKRHVDYEDGSEEDSWICQFSEEDAAKYGVPYMEFTKDIEEEGAVSGGTVCKLACETEVAGDIVPNSYGAASPILYLPEDADYEIVRMDEENDVRHFRYRQRMRRRLTKGTTGDMKTLVVRPIDTEGKSTDLTAENLEAMVFTDASCLKSRYHDCSYGKVNIVNGGIVDIEIDQAANNNDYKTLELSAKKALYAEYGGTFQSTIQQFDLILYCQPDGSKLSGGDWVAYGYVNGYETFYNNKWCGYVSGQMHEVGHNLGLGHSGLIAGEEYEDRSGMMGYSYALDDGPDMCFNAAKSYQLRWYEENNGVDSVDPLNLPGGSQSFDIIGVADYKTANGLVSLRLEYQGNTVKGKEWYIGYNHKSGINSGVPTHEDAAVNKVHLIEKVNNFASEYAYGMSNRVVALEAGQDYTWTIDEQEVTLVVNSIDGAVASITLTSYATNPPTLAPVPTISPVPSQTPSIPEPTIPPTKTGECLYANDKLVGTYVLLEVKLDDKSGSEFGWTLKSKIAWWAGPNFKYQNGATLLYGMCVPKEDCIDLTLEDKGGDGICGGNGDCGYKMIVGGKQVVTGDGKFGTGTSHSVCIGTEGPCKDSSGKLRYRKRPKKKTKRTTCKKINKLKARLTKKFCNYYSGKRGRDRIEEDCMVACGKVGLGSCKFLEDYEGASPTAEFAAVVVDPIDDNVFDHDP